MSSKVFGHEDLRNNYCSNDFYIGLVRYGDFNRAALEARACGTKLISYTGNPYAHYWIPEGDQRVMADYLIKVLKGDTQPREDILDVPDIKDTALEMVELYGRFIS
jgi:hypothetical protein